MINNTLLCHRTVIKVDFYLRNALIRVEWAYADNLYMK